MRFYIIDDDLATRKMLSRIIYDEVLGEVIGEADEAVDVEIEIISSQPDIVLIDLLMPKQDGIETIQNLKKRNFKGKYIMISQVENKEMVAKAYNEGIEYFIHKPINRVEVAAIIQKVLDQMKMEKSLNTIRESLAVLQNSHYTQKEFQVKKNIYPIIQNIFGDLGILGESGSNDLIDIVEYYYRSNNGRALLNENITMKDLYEEVLISKNKEGINIEEKELKALEQRVRRTINQAMTNLASIGLTDYGHPKFEHYATKFFDFHEIRLKMRELDNKNEKRKAKINGRKFIYALYNEMQQRLE